MRVYKDNEREWRVLSREEVEEMERVRGEMRTRTRERLTGMLGRVEVELPTVPWEEDGRVE